jgi:hypothetical protein
VADCHSDLDLAGGSGVHCWRAHSVVLTGASTVLEGSRVRDNPARRVDLLRRWGPHPGGSPVRRETSNQCQRRLAP